jgi:ATP-dependent DNA helicase RecG
MRIAQLRALTKRSESERLEFKTSTGSITSGMQTVCAFLNSDHGGTIIFGVTDSGKIMGQEVTDKTRKDIATELNKIEPHAKINVFYVRVSDERYAIMLSVDPGEKAPYSYDGRSFVRNQSTTTRMTREEYTYLHNQNNPTLWESLTSNTCTLRDLDNNRIREVVQMAVYEKRLPASAKSASIPDILKKLHLIIDDKLTNAAVILFCKNESKQFMQSTAQLARFRGIDKKQFMNTKLFTTNAFDLYDKAMDFLHFCLPVSARIEPGNPIRVEEPAIPYSVLREAVTNALIHRNYSHAGGSIAIAVYDDRVNISNIGALPKGVLLKQLSKEHPSIPRNPLIAHVFYICGKIEKWGRGTLDMIQDSKKAHNPIPKYEEIGGSFSLTLPLREPMPTIIFKEQPDIDINKLTDRQKEILHILSTEKLSRHQLMKIIRTPLADRTIQRELTTLMKMGLIKTEGGSKATVWSLVH